ncbi:hypothetical protein [Streptomyces albidus (ex Kaewkla and Franco 2022)]|uniref:hypothetical protein n=1 Tax=Streptomyces albidus (ex Kaewkla and Franco 2022) TaxID=722709 RepID=UPI0015EF64BD|nr:hypothetical protein [Streptomyces albidus (ex Kaewkla and Franco 2022)]
MSSPTDPDNGLPVRMPRPRRPGRHRKPEPVVAPENAPALVLAVPGTPSGTIRSLAEEILSIARSELPGMDARIGYVEGDGEEFPTLDGVLSQAAAEQQAAAVRAAELAAIEASEDGEASEEATAAAAADAQSAAEERLVAVVIPLLAGPDAARMRQIRQAVLSSGTGAELTDVLGPHPLLAEGVHVKLSEAGLARADRARLFTVATAADGIILATVGGEEAVQAAGITGMLLAARLAVPVLAAGLDEEGAVARIAEQLRESGSTQLAVAPCLIGPEVSEGLLDAAAAEAGCAVAEPLGAYPAVGKLVASTYAAKLGIAQQQSPQGMAAR